jgi:two-component system, LytTR family, response regulator
MNCIIVDDEPMTRLLIETLVQSTGILRLIKKCASANEALNVILKEDVDLVFLDVEMPGMSGIQMMEHLRGNDVQVILVTSKEQYAAKAFDFDVTDYIVKPITEERFLKAVLKAKKKHAVLKGPDDRDIFFKVKNSRMVKVNTKDILYIEALTNHVSIYSSSSERLIIHSTLKAMENRLPANHFLRLHNSFVVRLDKISALEGNCVVVNKKLIPVSRANWKTLTDRLEMI